MTSSLPNVIVAENLPLMEHFYTLQGEGYYTGVAAYFIRLGGCEVGCHWCDVKESWDASNFPRVAVAEIAGQVKAAEAKIAVITGGEPLMHPLNDLTTALHALQIRTHIETSGVYPITGIWDWICFSPKKFKTPDPSVFSQADELKVIIYNKTDLPWAESFVDKMPPGCHLFLQPEWSKKNDMYPLIVEYIKNNPRWRLSVQVHKYLNIP
jgi:7-carboxy-7-deazaguanine synthase